MFKTIINNLKFLVLEAGNPFCMFLLVFLLLYIYTKHSIHWDIFTARDIFRAQGWMNGQPFWLGPEMTAGNNLFGPFFYFLLLPPLIFGDNIYNHGFIWYLSWLALTYTLAFFFLEKISKHPETLLIFLITFITAIGTPLFKVFDFAWNPGFSVFFHILSVMALYYWRQTNNNLYLYLVGIIIAIGVQVHFFVSIHIITALLFCCFEFRKKILCFLLFLFFAMSPFIIYSVTDYFYAFETSASHSISHLSYLKNNIFSKKWFENIRQALNFSIIESIFLFLFVILKKSNQRLFLSVFTQSTKDLFIIISVPCLAGILVGRFFWYMHFVPIFVILLFSKLHDDCLSASPDKKTKYLFIYGALLIFFLLLVNNGDIMHLLSFNKLSIKTYIYIEFLLSMSLIALSLINITWTSYKDLSKICVLFVFLFTVTHIKLARSLSYPSPPQHTISRTWPNYQELYPLLEKVFLETKWSAKEATKRIYVVGVHPQLSLLSNYAMTTEIAKQKITLYKTDMSLGSDQFSKSPQGYMIIQNLKKFINYSVIDWTQYLSHSSLLSEFLRHEIAKKKIVIKTPKLYHSFWLIPYETTEKSAFVEGFHNIGQPYYWEEPQWLKNCNSTTQFRDKNGFYYCMVLPGFLQRAGVYIKLFENPYNELSSSQITLHVNFFGPLIGSSDGRSNMNGSALWSDIKIRLLCGSTYYTHNIPDIGNNWRRIQSNPEYQGQALTAPLKLRIPISFTEAPVFNYNCTKETFKKLELTFVHLYNKQYVSKFLPQYVKIVWRH